MRITAAALLSAVVVAALDLGEKHHTANVCPWTPPFVHPTCGPQEFGDGGNFDQQTLDTAPRSQPTGWIDAELCVQKYCLFANHHFAEGHGIAVISTRENLEKVKAIVNRSSTSHERSTASAQFHATEIKGKGLGLLADQAFNRGTRVMTRTPALVIHRAFLEQVPPGSQHPLLDAAVDLMPPPTRAKFLSQMVRSSGNRVADIMATNAFQIDLGGDDGHHYGNFPDVSRFNHDCRPNVAFYIDENLVHTTSAVRVINPGEELSISYLGNFEPREMRRRRARQAWGFDCTCSQCSLPERLGTKSDRRLEEIARAEDQLTQMENREVTPAMIRKFVKMHKDERLDSSIASAYTLAALNFRMLGDEKMALKYAKLAAEAGIIESGPDSDTVKSVEGLIRSLA